MSDLKICSQCKEGKPRLSFYKNSRHNDGLAYECKACNYACVKKCRNNKAKHYKTTSQAYRNTSQAKAIRKAWLNTPEAKAKKKEANRKYYQNRKQGKIDKILKEY